MNLKSLITSEELSSNPPKVNKMANATLQSLSDDLREAIAASDWMAVQVVADRLEGLAGLVQQKAIERGRSKDDFQKMLETA